MLNLALFSGNKVVEPENVEELDGSERYSIPSASGKREHSIKKDRDILRKVTIDNDNFCTRLIAGVEQQSDVHYAMPVRDMLYDSLKYTQQLDFGELSDEVTELILDYKMVLLQPENYSEKQSKNMQSSLGVILGLLNCAETKEDFQKYLDSHEKELESLSERAMAVLNEYCELDIPEKEIEDDVNNLYPAMQRSGLIEDDLNSDTPQYLLPIMEGVREGVDAKVFVNFLRMMALCVSQKEALHQDVLDQNIDMIFEKMFEYIFDEP